MSINKKPEICFNFNPILQIGYNLSNSNTYTLILLYKTKESEKHIFKNQGTLKLV